MAESCSFCGTVGDASDWSFSIEDERVRWLCPDCARRNIRSIEGKLPEEWWE